MDHRAAAREAMGTPEERIRRVREFAESERVAAEWSSESDPAADWRAATSSSVWQAGRP